jgi:hypothetical protein
MLKISLIIKYIGITINIIIKLKSIALNMLNLDKLKKALVIPHPKHFISNKLY